MSSDFKDLNSFEEKPPIPPVIWILVGGLGLLVVLLGALLLRKPKAEPAPAPTSAPEVAAEHVHNWVADGCTEPAVCTVCGETRSAAGHSWAAATCTEPEKCSVCGETRGSAAGHSWTAATCIAPSFCSVCGETRGSAAGHSWTAATCVRPAACAVCGETRGSALGHSWTPATYAHPRTCSVCGEAEGSPLGSSGGGNLSTEVELFTENTAYGQRYSVAVAHSGSLEACKTCVCRLRDNGYNAFLYEQLDKGGYAILIGVFPSAQDAKDYAEYLHTQPEVVGVRLDSAYALSRVYLTDEAASRYQSTRYEVS